VGNSLFKYGISLVSVSENPLEIIGAVDTGIFKFVELTGVQSELPGMPELLATKNLKIANVRDFIEKNLSVNVCDQTDKMKKEFISCFRAKLESFSEKFMERGKSLSMDFSIENGLDSPLFEDSRIELVKKIALILYGGNTGFLVNARIPSAGKLSPAYLNSFLVKLMSANVSLSVDIHPHEVARKDDVDEIFRPFRFTAGQVNLVYEAESGNMLVEKLLDIWLAVLRKFDYRHSLIFCPVIKNPSHFISEMNRLGEMLQKKSS